MISKIRCCFLCDLQTHSISTYARDFVISARFVHFTDRLLTTSKNLLPCWWRIFVMWRRWLTSRRCSFIACWLESLACWEPSPTSATLFCWYWKTWAWHSFFPSKRNVTRERLPSNLVCASFWCKQSFFRWLGVPTYRVFQKRFCYHYAVYSLFDFFSTISNFNTTCNNSLYFYL